jgi:hypothetical protein
VTQPCEEISAAAGSLSKSGFPVIFEPDTAPGATPPAIVSAISTAGTESPNAIPTGRREMRRSRPRSRNGQTMSSTMKMVGMMIVAKISSHGDLKMRRSSKRNRKYHSGRGSVTCTAGLALPS